MAAGGIGTDHLASPLPVIPMGCLSTGVANVSFKMSDINIVVGVLMPDNIDHLGFPGGRVVEKLTVEPERFRLNITVVPEEPPITVESDGQRSSVESGFLIQLADDGANLVLAPGLRDSRHRHDSFQYFSDSQYVHFPFFSKQKKRTSELNLKSSINSILLPDFINQRAIVFLAVRIAAAHILVEGVAANSPVCVFCGILILRSECITTATRKCRAMIFPKITTKRKEYSGIRVK